MINHPAGLRQRVAKLIVTSTRQALLRATASVAFLIILQSHAQASEPTLEEALRAPPADLAQGYLFTKSMLNNALAMAEMGITVHTQEGKVTSKNASKYRKRYKTRQAIYNEAIEQRGYDSLAGRYRAQVSPTCARVGAMWIGVINSENVTAIEIIQNGVDASLKISALHDGEPLTLENEAAVVESSIVLVDQMNSDYYFAGRRTDDGIIIHPDVGVLSSWPGWAAPPQRGDILECTVALIPTGHSLPQNSSGNTDGDEQLL